jgi:hypothetical protein
MELISTKAFEKSRDRIVGFNSLKKEVVAPGINPGGALASLTIEGAILYWDICAACGVARYTRIESVSLQAQVQQMPGPGGFPPMGGRNPFGGLMKG